MRLAYCLGIGGQLPAGDALAVSGSVVAGVLTGLGEVVFGMVCLAVAAIHGLTILTETTPAMTASSAGPISVCSSSGSDICSTSSTRPRFAWRLRGGELAPAG